MSGYRTIFPASKIIEVKCKLAEICGLYLVSLIIFSLLDFVHRLNDSQNSIIFE